MFDFFEGLEKVEQMMAKPVWEKMAIIAVMPEPTPQPKCDKCREPISGFLLVSAYDKYCMECASAHLEELIEVMPEVKQSRLEELERNFIKSEVFVKKLLEKVVKLGEIEATKP